MAPRGLLLAPLLAPRLGHQAAPLRAGERVVPAGLQELLCDVWVLVHASRIPRQAAHPKRFRLS
jgi:hypothetical protein